MACYIASNNNRFYAALETSYGTAAAVTNTDRIPAISLRVQQSVGTPDRIDKTGRRTFPGLPGGFRKRTSFDLTTLMAGWNDLGTEPGYGSLFRAALGAAPLLFTGGTVQMAPDPARIVFTGPHGLGVDQALVSGGELRFVAAVADAQTVVLNAPLTNVPGPGDPIGPTATYLPANDLPSITIFDYWDPVDFVQRAVTGGGVDRMRIRVNGDFHQFTFAGLASDVVDSASFVEGQAGLTTFPEEPPVAPWDYSLVPGNLGQAWVGASSHQFFSVLEAEVLLDNDLELRSREFGSILPRCMVPGFRRVTTGLRLFASTRTETIELYQAARQRSPIGVMLQLGQQNSHLCGVYLKAVVPEVPEFDDDELRLQWRFSNCRAQGAGDDEIVVAFG